MEERIDTFGNDVARLSQWEAEAYQEFVRIYSLMHSLPVKVHAKMDWEFYTSLATSIAGVVLAAFRTGQAFYLAAVAHGNPIFSLVEAIVAVIAIEGSLVLFALQDARAKQKSIDGNARVLGLMVTLVLSAVAGLYQSSNLLVDQGNRFVTGMNWFLVLLMGVGATAIAYLGGDILGVQIVRYEKETRELSTLYDNELAVYDDAMNQAWLNSKENEALQRRKRTDYKPEPTNEPVRSPRKRTANERTNEGTNDESRLEIFALMDQYYLSMGEKPGQAQVCRMLAIQRDGSEVGFERYKSYVNKIWHQWTPPQPLPIPAPEEIIDETV